MKPSESNIAHVHLFPSSIDAAHFGRARTRTDEPEPEDQRDIPRPRIGFFGVLDERLDHRSFEGSSGTAAGLAFYCGRTGGQNCTG